MACRYHKSHALARPMVQASYLRLAAYSPQRIARAVLVVPAGFVTPPILPMAFRLVLPMLLYRIAPSRERLVRALRPIAEEVDEQLLQVTGAVFRHVRIEPEMPRTASSQELADFRAPTLVLAAGEDMLFPGEAVVSKARQVIPNLVAAEVLEGSTHSPPGRYHEHIIQHIREFLDVTCSSLS